MDQKKPTITEQLDPFDFDYWMELAENDPERFEAHRNRAIEQVIDSSPPFMQRRLRGLQWRIDMEIRRSKNAMDGCVRINRMMMNSIYAGGGLVESIRGLFEPSEREDAPGGVVLPFRRQSGI